MHRTSYASWATFDVEKELERVDEAQKREAQQKQVKKQLQAKENVESSATQAAQHSADILAAQAAVAALKIKRKTRKGGRQKAGRGAAGVDADTEKAAAEAAELQAQAKLFARKHELLQQIMTNRRRGDRLIAHEKQDWKAARKVYETALAATADLEALAPSLQTVEATWLATSSEQDTYPVSRQDNTRGHEVARPCCGDKHVSSQKPNANVSLPNANDLLAIIKMFYKDVYEGIGTCELGENRLAAATEAFKEVLLRDDGQWTAWLKRGEAFEKMEAPLLAMLHYNRIATMDTKHAKAKEALERVKTKLLVEGDASSDKDTIQRAVSACTEGRTLQEALEQVRLVFEAATVLAVEGFYGYSATKFQIVLGCLDAVRARPETSSTNNDAVLPVLQELEISCHLNIACGCLETQRNYVQGLAHCEQAIRLNGSEHTEEQYELALTTIDKATDKCEFDRSQYDMEYLRTLAAKQSKD